MKGWIDEQMGNGLFNEQHGAVTEHFRGYLGFKKHMDRI